MRKPIACHDLHLEYLDNLRKSGITNMYGASPYLQENYPELTKDEVRDILIYWMKTFSGRNPFKKEPLENE